MAPARVDCVAQVNEGDSTVLLDRESLEEPLGDKEIPKSQYLDYIVKKKVMVFIYMMERLEDHKVAPLSDLVEDFFYEYELLTDAKLEEVENTRGERLNTRIRKIEKFDQKLLSARNRLSKDVKKILDKKEFKRFRSLILGMELPRGINVRYSNGRRGGFNRNDDWMRGMNGGDSGTSYHPLIGNPSNQ